jgi:glycosyltransferase involved in cell wall biosynthesis
MHPVVQRRRRKVLLGRMREHLAESDALLMWGSWFEPFPRGRGQIPVFHYVDQSHSLSNLPGERRGRFARRRRAHALQGECYANAAAIFCMSEWARQQTLEAHDVNPAKVIAVGWGPCGIDLSKEAEFGSGEEPIVLHVSNAFYRKGLDYLAETAERVCAAVPNARFVVVGRDRTSFKVPVSSRIEYLGPIYDKERLAQLFRSASLFFLPHRFDRSPHVLVEAMSAGLPLVASSQGGAIELIDGESNGYLCAPGEIAAYAEAIITLLRDRALRRQMGESGRRLVRQKYNWSTIAERIVAHMSSTDCRPR